MNGLTLVLLRGFLLTIRAQADAALALLGEMPAPAEGEPCTHPPEKRKPQPVGGDLEQFLCTACHTLVSGKKPAEAVP